MLRARPVDEESMRRTLRLPGKFQFQKPGFRCFLLSLALIFAAPATLWAADCTSLIIGLYSQQDVDNFQANHGPCDRVLTLYIEGSDITNLDGLSALAEVGSSLNITNNDVLIDTNGLSSLTSVGRNILIQNNASLTNLDGFSALTSVNEDLLIYLNGALVNIDGLSGLTYIGASLVILENVELTSIDGLSALSSIGVSDHADQRFLHIGKNDALRNLDGLSALTTVGPHPSAGGSSAVVMIENNASLTDLNGLSALSSILGDLYITDNPSLLSVDGLSSLTRVYDLGIGGNTALTSIGGLSSLTNVENLGIGQNDALTDLSGLSSLTTIWRDLEISNNLALTNLDALSGLTHVGNNLEIQSNHQLNQCTGLSRLLDQWDDAQPGPGSSEIPDVGGETIIGDNLAGCNSIQDILAGVDPSRLNAGLNDAWYDKDTDGQGFFITIFPDLGFVSLAWFTYDTELPPPDATANLGDPGHRWLTAIGPITGNRVQMNIDITSGGIFDTSTVIKHTDPKGSDGTITLTFDSCNSGTVEYDITSINQQGTIPIRRVADDNIVLCEMLGSAMDP